jgi:hypothetical protein
MKAKVVEKVKFAPGKWKEAGELMKTFKEAAEKQGFPPIRIYGFISGGDVVQTLNFVTDWTASAPWRPSWIRCFLIRKCGK